MDSGVARWEIDGTNGGVRHRYGCRVMGRGGEEHHCRPRGRVLLLLAVDTDDDDDDDVGVGMDDGGDRWDREFAERRRCSCNF